MSQSNVKGRGLCRWRRPSRIRVLGVGARLEANSRIYRPRHRVKIKRCQAALAHPEASKIFDRTDLRPVNSLFSFCIDDFSIAYSTFQFGGDGLCVSRWIGVV